MKVHPNVSGWVDSSSLKHLLLELNKTKQENTNYQ